MSKKIILNVTYIAAMGLCAAALLGCSTKSSSDAATENNLNKSYYPPSEILKKFADDNPDCPLWSDWESLCSYTKKGGGIECHDDPTHKVEPSAPFCFKPRFQTVSDAELKAMNRFCDVSEPYKVEIYGDLSAAEVVEVVEKDICRQFLSDRPFSGLNMATVHSPLCKIWKTRSFESICQSADSQAPSDKSVPTCESLALAQLPLDQIPACHELITPIGCEQIWHSYDDSDCGYPPPVGEDASDRICTGDTWFPRSAVRGVYCSVVNKEEN